MNHSKTPSVGSVLKENVPLVFSEKMAVAGLIVSILIYVAFYSVVCVLLLRAFSYDDFDLAHHDQIMWNLLHGRFFNSILGINFLGNHMHPISFLLIPIYAMCPGPVILLVIQSIALGIAAVPLYLLARMFIGYKWALLGAVVYLVYPALGFMNIFHFHPVIFVVPFLFFMLYFFYRNRFAMYLLFVVLSAMCQENIALIIICMGFYALIKRKSIKWILTPILLGSVCFYLCVVVLIPFFNSGLMNFAMLYSHLGNSLSEAVVNVIKSPLPAIKYMFMPIKIGYLMQLFVPVTLIPLFSPLSLLPSIPMFLQHLLSSRPTEVTIYYHYSAEIIPYIFLAFILGLSNLLKLKLIRKIQFPLALIILFISFYSALAMGSQIYISKLYKSMLARDELDECKAAFLKDIPKASPVVSTFETLPYLTSREKLYSFHHIYSGRYTMSSKPFDLEEPIEYALIDFNDKLLMEFYNHGNYANIQAFLKKQDLKPLGVKNSIVLFRKGGDNGVDLFKVIDNEPKPQTVINVLLDDEIWLKGCDVRREKDIVRVTLYWECVKETDKDFNTFFDFVNANTPGMFRAVVPVCYRIYPTHAWREGGIVKDDKYLVVPKRMMGKEYKIKMGIYSQADGKILKMSEDDLLGRITIS